MVCEHFLFSITPNYGKLPMLPSVDKGQHGFLGHLRHLAVLSSLPGVSPAASAALPDAKSASKKLRGTCQRKKIGAGKEEDEGGLTPTKDDDAVSVDFSRWQAYCPLSTEGNQIGGQEHDTTNLRICENIHQRTERSPAAL